MNALEMCQKPTSDAIDAAPLEQFKKKREEWLLYLNGNDVHSIWKQQSSLLWDYALFQTIRALRKEALANPIAGVGFNEPVLRLFEAGFAVIQATSIRRLTEKQWKNPSKRVISLRALVDDIRENRELLTREIYLGLHELPFDPAPVKQRFFDSLTASGQKFVYVGMDTRGPDAWAEAESAHERFDKLSDRTPASRSGCDLVSLKWFDLMDAKIKSCEDVCVLTDKFMAHAANSVSRAGLKERQTTLSLSQLAECHRAMLQVAAFLGAPLLQDSISTGLPTPQFDLLENLDKAWVGSTALAKAREHWQMQADEIEKWTAVPLENPPLTPPISSVIN